MTRSADPAPYPTWNSSVEPAPGDLRIVQAFVNTRDVEDATDTLDTPQGLAEWLAAWGLLQGAGIQLREVERRQAIELREGLRELLLANAGHAAGDEARLDGLARTLVDLPLRCALDETGTYELVAVGHGWQRAAARMLTLVTRAMADGTWKRMKACRRDDCRWAFYDYSKNRSGKWCAMVGCGDLMKARAYRQRRRDRVTGRAGG